jgi:hypothetical protein
VLIVSCQQRLKPVTFRHFRQAATELSTDSTAKARRGNGFRSTIGPVGELRHTSPITTRHSFVLSHNYKLQPDRLA